MIVERKLKGLDIAFKRISKKYETGRSMVEMLGVLAVVGVLSITGIYGYTIAMAKYRADEAAQYVSMAHVMIKTAPMLYKRKQADLSLDLPEGSPVSLEGTSSYKNAGIKVDFGSDVDACKQFVLLYQNNSDFYVKADCTE